MSTPRPAWPIPRAYPSEDVQAAARASQARFHLALGALKAALEDQPTPAAVRTAGRRWIAAASQLIDDTAKTHRGNS